MARTRTSGKVLSADPTATMSKADKLRERATASVAPEFAEFAATWNGLDAGRRRRIRRMIRVGQPQADVEDAELAVGFAAYQRTRPWFRYFWLWIVPLALLAMVAGAGIHPVVVGLVLGGAASAVLVRRGLTRVEKVNAELLDGTTVAATA
jgi:hypothetical protein